VAEVIKTLQPQLAEGLARGIGVQAHFMRPSCSLEKLEPDR